MISKIFSYQDPIAPDVDVRISNEWMSAETYCEVAQKMIIPCTDIVFYQRNNQTIYLGKRLVFPMKGIWFFGGRMFFNDRTPEDSSSRCIETETGLRIDPERFVLIRTNLYSWLKTAQSNAPGKNLVMTHGCEVTDEEIIKMLHGLSEKEYDLDFGIQRFDRSRLIDQNVHLAIVDIYDQLFG